MRADLFVHQTEKTSAVFGRNADVGVAFQGDGACTNGRMIYLPSIDLNGDVSDETAAIMRGYIDHEAGHVRYTDFPYVSEWAQDASALARQFENCIEDIRLEKHVRRAYPGAARNLRATTESVNQEYLDNVPANDPRNADPRFIAPVAVTWAGRRDYGGPTCEQCLERLPDDLRRLVEGWVERIDERMTSRDVCAMADELASLFESPSDEKDEQPDESSDESRSEDSNSSDESESGECEASEGDNEDGEDKAGANQDEDDEENDGDAKASVGEDGDAMPDEADEKGSDDSDDYASEGGDGPRSDLESAKTRMPDEPVAPYAPEEASEIVRKKASAEGLTETTRDSYRPYTRAYDKWHHQTDERYKYWCPVREDNANSLGYAMRRKARASDYQETLRDAGGSVALMRRKLSRALLAKQKRDWSSGHTEGRLDSRRFAAAVSGRDAVFKRREDADDMDTAVTIMVDLSGSMIGERAEVAQQVVVALSEVLDKPGIPFEVLGFSSRTSLVGVTGREEMKMDKEARGFSRYAEPMDMIEFKRFGERLVKARGAVALVQRMVGGNNCDGESVALAYDRLRQRPESRKVMMVLSDGEPLAHGDGGAMNRHLKKVVRDIEATPDTSVIGIGIQTEAVHHFYERAVSVSSLKDLTGEALDQLAKLMMGERYRLRKSA